MMGMSPRLELRQTQSLVMTPQLQQAIRLLQMSNLELAEYVAKLVEANPLLEVARAPQVRGATATAASADGPSASDLVETVQTLRAHLLRQLGMARADRPVLAAAVAVVEELDDDGYLRTPLEEIRQRYGFRADAVEAGLALVQQCEPTGVGARNLAECFRLQLIEANNLDPAMEAVLAHLHLLSEVRRDRLATTAGVDPAALARMLETLRHLDPKPGLRFADDRVAAVVPDIFVRKGSNGWDVELNTETLPRVLVNNAYGLELGHGDREVRTFISECSAQAGWLVRSLEQRARTILKVAGEIVRQQERFLTDGVGGLRPLSQRAVADKVGLHESTVSRVTAGKHLSCALGTYELRFFFSQPIQATGGGEAFSSVAVRDRIRTLIQSEPRARTLSDDTIVAILQGEGIEIARRTVAKYRGDMGIPSSVDRRRLQALVFRP
jgi:RNA polymerase sigma-54 factor